MSYKVPITKCRMVRDGRKMVSVPSQKVTSFGTTAELFRVVMKPKDLPHEEVWLALVDATGSVLQVTRISQGGMHGAALTPRDVLRPAIAANASGIVMCHNHPSGDPTPSIEDVELTRNVVSACKMIGVDFLDHIIVASGGARSLRDMGLFS